MIKVSIVMPVFQAERFIDKAVQSILNQTLTDWELLLIDDGSTDGTSELCDQYALQDSRIKVLHKANEGVAMARQMGVDNAQGEYCIHADADDWVEPTMLEELYNEAQKQHADVVIADYYVNTKGTDKVCKQTPSGITSQQVLMDMFNNKLFGSLWHKLIRTELYKNYDARFFKGINHCEDLLIWVQLLQHSDLKIAYLPKAFYHYSVNDASITRNFTRSTYETRLSFRDKLQELLLIPDAEKYIANVSFGIFTEGFIYNVLSDVEIKEGLNLYEQQIKQLSSPKWRLGFFLLSLGFSKLAHKLIHY